MTTVAIEPYESCFSHCVPQVDKSCKLEKENQILRATLARYIGKATNESSGCGKQNSSWTDTFVGIDVGDKADLTLGDITIGHVYPAFETAEGINPDFDSSKYLHSPTSTSGSSSSAPSNYSPFFPSSNANITGCTKSVGGQHKDGYDGSPEPTSNRDATSISTTSVETEDRRLGAFEPLFRSFISFPSLQIC